MKNAASATGSAGRSVSWLALALALVFSSMMLYLPYQFQAVTYRYLQPLLVPFGLTFLAVAVVLGLSVTGIGLPVWAGRGALLCVAFCLAVWVAVQAAAVGFAPGMGAHLILGAAFVVAAAVPKWNDAIFRGIYAAILIWIGILILAARTRHPGSLLGLPWTWAEAAFLTGALLQPVGHMLACRHKQAAWSSMMLPAVLLSYYAVVWIRMGNWLGAGLAATMAAGALVHGAYLLRPWALCVPSVRRRLLALAVSLAVIPVFLLGALFSYLIMAMHAANRANAAAAHIARWWILGTGGIGLLAFGLALVLGNRIARGLAGLHRAVVAIAELLAGSLEPADLANHIVRAVVPFLGDWALLQVEGEEAPTATAHLLPEKEELGRAFLGRYVSSEGRPSAHREVYRTDRPVLIPEVTEAYMQAVLGDTDQVAMMRKMGVRSYMLVPLLARGRRIGVLTLAITESAVRYGDDDLALAGDVARLIALALDNARLHAALRESEALLAGNQEVLEQVAAGRPVPEVLEAIVRFAEKRLDQGCCFIQLLDETGGRFRSIAAASLGEVRQQVPGIDAPVDKVTSVNGEAARVRKPVLCADVAAAGWGEDGERLLGLGILACWACPILDKAGAVVGVITFAHTRTGLPTPADYQTMATATQMARIAIERQRLEEDRVQKLYSLIRHMAEGVVAVDGEGRVVFTNAAALGFLGLQAQAGSEPLSQLDLPEPLARQLQRAAQPGSTAPERLLWRQGSIEIEAHVSPVFTEFGRYGAVAVMRDMTAEAQLRRLQENFVANVSHELRGPLASLSATLEAMSDGLVPPEHRPRYFNAMLGEMERLRRLSFDVIDLTRLDSGVAALDQAEFSLQPVFEAMLARSEQRCATAGIDLLVEPADLTVRADYDRVEQVMANLVDNAIRHTPAGGTIRIFAGREGEMVRITVADTGQGISAEHLELIWERFYKVDGARTRRPGSGTGLGLAIVRTLVERMGGEVQVTSEPGRGATFSFTVPAA